MVGWEFIVINIAITCGIQWAGFAVAFALQTEKFYDVLGGLNYVALAVYSSLAEPGWIQDPRRIASTTVFVCSRCWLLIFLAWRAGERKGDARFDEVKDKFWRFFVFWTAQAMWVLTISMPVLFVNSMVVDKPQFSMFDWVTISGFALGVIIEVIGDVQKARWVKAGRLGGFCTVGLWNYSRHPNYFGEMLQWWCAWAFAYASGSGFADPWWWACILSPLFTMQILMNVPASGLAQANGKSLKRYYDQPDVAAAYIAYREGTSILLPMVGYRYVPMCLKRTVFLDLKKYEYRPRSPVVSQLSDSF